MLKREPKVDIDKHISSYGCSSPEEIVSYTIKRPTSKGPDLYVSYEEADYNILHEQQQKSAVKIYYDKYKKLHWWMFQDEFYWENEGLDALEVKALLLGKKGKKQERINRAINSLNSTDRKTKPKNNRNHIPDRVKREVWRRDQGRCVKCGSQKRLEYDHIIPVSKGGSNTERNIQLLCENCNRSKSDNI